MQLVRSFREEVGTWLESLDEFPSTASVLTGIEVIDLLTGGFRRGQLTTVAARPGVGATAFAINAAVRQAGAGHRVLYLSLDQPTAELAGLAASVSLLYQTKTLRPGLLDAVAFSRLIDGVSTIADLSISFGELRNPGADDLRAAIEAASGEAGIVDIVYVDHHQALLLPDPAFVLRHLADEAQCSVVSLCSIDRSVEDRVNEVPRLGDLADDGGLEVWSSLVIGLFRTRSIDGPDSDGEPDTLNVSVLRSRTRQVGAERLVWDGERQLITSIEPEIWGDEAE